MRKVIALLTLSLILTSCSRDEFKGEEAQLIETTTVELYDDSNDDSYSDSDDDFYSNSDDIILSALSSSTEFSWRTLDAVVDDGSLEKKSSMSLYSDDCEIITKNFDRVTGHEYRTELNNNLIKLNLKYSFNEDTHKSCIESLRMVYSLNDDLLDAGINKIYVVVFDDVDTIVNDTYSPIEYPMDLVGKFNVYGKEYTTEHEYFWLKFNLEDFSNNHTLYDKVSTPEILVQYADKDNNIIISKRYKICLEPKTVTGLDIDANGIVNSSDLDCINYCERDGFVTRSTMIPMWFFNRNYSIPTEEDKIIISNNSDTNLYNVPYLYNEFGE